MKVFRFEAEVTISVTTTVKAETLKEALEEAEKRDIEYSRETYLDKYSWIASSIDGEAQNIKEI